MTDRYRPEDLVASTATLFARAGLDDAIARTVADVLVTADLLGYDTHGLQFVPAYLKDIESGRWTLVGEPKIVKDEGAALVIDGGDLPGQWVMMRALDLILPRAAELPLVAISIHRCQNISCLAVYMRRVAMEGLLGLLAASAPTNAVVAPHGGRTPLYSTNPFAAGIPTEDTPILIDTSSSSTTNRRIERTHRAGDRLPQRWLVDNEGRPSDDPACIYDDPPGAILPAGGVDQGHKGFALGLLVEALTSGLSGHGRAGQPPVRGNVVYLQLINPRAFGGIEAFRMETSTLARSCRDSAPVAGGPPVRLPGDRAATLHEQQIREGIALHDEVMPRLRPLLSKYGVAAPAPI